MVVCIIYHQTMNDSSAHHEEFASAKQPRPNPHTNNKDEIVSESIIPTELNGDKDNASLIGTVGSKSNDVKKVSGGINVCILLYHIHI